MSTFIKSSVVLAASLLAWAAAPLDLHAQSYPARPVKLVVPYPPGGSADILGRLVAQKLADQLGQPVTIENRAGAGTRIGAEYVAQSPADGYTLLLGTVSSHAMNPALVGNVGYDPVKDFVAVAPVATIPFVLIVRPSVPAANLAEFVQYAKQHPGKINYASAGIGTSNHLAGELFKQTAGIDMVHIPYKGSAPALQDVIAGQVQTMFDLVSTSQSWIRAGSVKPLAVTGSARVAALPDVPTMKEAGYADFVVTAWFGLFAPAGTPAAIVTRLGEETQKALDAPDLKAKLAQSGMERMSESPSAFALLVGADLAKWRALVKAANIKSQ